MSTDIALPQINFKHTIVTDIELINGKKTQVITIFNSCEINFEEMAIGISTALERQSRFYNNIKSTQHTFCSIKEKGLNEIAKYHKQEFKPNNNKFN
ncbi:hypothetical protein [Flavobacterium aestuarii]|uniref:hypothetical protein n=1 Tax=Flavobacterium aestuarii TaxID=3149227 RepID=UPI0032B4DCA3